MTKTFEEWIGELEEITDGDHALTLEQLKQVLEASNYFAHVEMRYVELHADNLMDLLTAVSYQVEHKSLQNYKPIIVITQEDNGNFQAWITAEVEDKDDDPPTQEKLYELTHNMTEEALWTHDRNCQCPRCSGDPDDYDDSDTDENWNIF